MTEQAPRLGVSYFGNRYPHHARHDLRAIADTGASFVVHVMSEADLRWNPDTMAELVRIGHGVGLESWFVPWALGGLFGGESASYAVGEHPEACQRGSDGGHLAALCPRHPGFRALADAWLDAVAATGATIVQWDELHLALPHRRGTRTWACRCDGCQAAYAAQYGEAMPVEWTPRVEQFMDALLGETLGWLAGAAQERGLASSIVLLADESYDPEFWRGAARLPGVRYFGTTAFWLFYGIPPGEVVSYTSLWAERTLAATAGSEAAAMGWVQAFAMPAGREAEIEQVVATLREAGIPTMAVWSYLACEAMSRLAAADTEATWDAVERAFALAREAGSQRGGGR